MNLSDNMHKISSEINYEGKVFYAKCLEQKGKSNLENNITKNY